MASNALRRRADEDEAHHDVAPQPAAANDALSTVAPVAPRPIVVLMIAPSLDAGAAAANVRDVVGILERAGHRAVVVSRRGPACNGAAWVPLNVASRNPAVMLANAARLARLVKEWRCDVVHAHGRAGAWSAYLAARLTGRPLVTTWYKGFREQNRLKRAYNGVMARGDRVVAVSEQIAELIGDRYGTGRERVRVLPPCVDTARFDPAAVPVARIAALRRAWGIAEGTRVLLVPGRILRRKGHHVVVQAARQLKTLGLRDFVCLFATQDAGTRYAGELWDQVLATGTADVVRLVGPVEDMPAAYAAATVVLSAAVQPEGLSRVLLEAQAMARPVIVSDLGAGSDLVLTPASVGEDRTTGLRFPAGDAAALAGMVVRLLSMPQGERAAMGARGRAWVCGNFDPATVTAQTLALYAEVTAQQRVS
jgi:glycosyltransferase involved in cell wall biosynthesis